MGQCWPKRGRSGRLSGQNWPNSATGNVPPNCCKGCCSSHFEVCSERLSKGRQGGDSSFSFLSPPPPPSSRHIFGRNLGFEVFGSGTQAPHHASGLSEGSKQCCLFVPARVWCGDERAHAVGATQRAPIRKLPATVQLTSNIRCRRTRQYHRSPSGCVCRRRCRTRRTRLRALVGGHARTVVAIHVRFVEDHRGALVVSWILPLHGPFHVQEFVPICLTFARMLYNFPSA